MTMFRCNRSAGIYRVEFAYLDSDGEPMPGEYNADIGPHHDVVNEREARLIEAVPRVSQSKPFEGELCACEVAWLKKLPGLTYSRHRRYTLTPLGETNSEASEERPDVGRGRGRK